MTAGNEAAGDLLAASLTEAPEGAAELRPRVHPGDADDEVACALAALCLEVRALTFAVMAATRK